MATKKKKDQKVDGYTGAAKKTQAAQDADKLRKQPGFQKSVKDDAHRKKISSMLEMAGNKKEGSDKSRRYDAAVKQERSNQPKKRKKS